MILHSYTSVFSTYTSMIGNFPTKTYSNRILSDVNVSITYEDVSERELNVYKACTQLNRRVPVRRYALINITTLV